jgi:small conductance mechanosensitive channel
MNRLYLSVVLIVLTIILAGPTVRAQEPKYTAVTAADPNVPADDLGLLLKPLRKQELVVEAEAWLALLQAKVRQISLAEIQVREQSRGVAATKQEAGAGAGLQTKVKEQLLAGINKLREEQTALLDRVQVAIEALRAKGGEVGEYEKYAVAVSGLSVDVKDISATRAMVIGWLKSPEGGLRWVKMIVAFVLILGASQVAASLLGRLTRRAVAMNKKCSDLFKDFLVNVVHKVVLVMGLVIALSVLGINVGPLVAGIGALGFIVGFALQGTLGNFAAGMMILLHRPYDVGDVVNTAGITGVVQSMSLNTTTIKTFDNQIVVIPNGSIWGNNITNVTGSDTRRVDMTFGIGYGDDQAKAQRILESIVNAHALVLKDPAPTVKLHELGDSSVNFVCRPWTQTANYWTVYWDITRSVKERFDAEGISIPFPQRDVHVYHETVEPASLSKALQKGLGGKTAVGADDDRA